MSKTSNFWPIALRMMFVTSLCVGIQPTYAAFMDGESFAIHAAHYRNLYGDKFSGDPETAIGAAYFAGFVSGIADSLDRQNFCIPPGVTPTAMIRALANELPNIMPSRSNNEGSSANGALITIAFLSQLYPCGAIRNYRESTR